MNNKWQKFGALALGAAMATSLFAGCFGPKVDYSDPEITATDDEIYAAALGDFETYYNKAQEQTSVSAKFAVMAQAEAKLLESGVYTPTSSQGGVYALGRVVPGTVSPTLWGNDQNRQHGLMTTETLITSADRDALKAKYAELKGTGRYAEEAKQYLQSHGYTLKNWHAQGYTSDPKTWDLLNTYRAADAEAIVNTVDGLVEYDNEGVMQPALATSWEVSEDGLKYTFHIREGVKWVNVSGQEVATVKAEDWVTGTKHLLDIQGGTEYLLEGVVKNVSKYLAGEIEDFAEVGIKAVDDYTLEYTLEQPTSYFLTMFGYNPFTPANAAFIEQQGDDYGTAPDKILYCGPYLVTNATEKTKIEFTLNESYWNKANVVNNKITWLFNDGSDATKSYVDMKAGTIDSCGLTTTTLPMAKEDGIFESNKYVSSTDATSYGMFYNLKRQGYKTEGYPEMDSTKTRAEKEIAVAAMQNHNFRLALNYGFDRAAYNAIEVGEDCKYFSLINSYTPGNFVSLDEEVTIEMNGQNKTYPAGTFYGQIMQDQITADGYKMKVWDPEAEGGLGSSAGFDGWYNAEEAKAKFAAAVAELAADGVIVDAAHPVVLDYPYVQTNEVYAARANAMKQAFETLFEGKVVINLVAASKMAPWYYVGYYAESGADCNYDLYDCSGWGPDYGDPQTYLATMRAEIGDMIKMLGVY